jgi:CCR4-NOT transcription complex subunit 4
MFLHETGDDDDSFSRQDLSSMNAAPSQRPASSSAGPSSTSKRPHPVVPPPSVSQTVLQPASAVSQSMARRGSKDGNMSRSDSGDGSALPSTATWVKHPQLQQSRRSSQAASRFTPSPTMTTSKIPAASIETQPVAEAVQPTPDSEPNPPYHDDIPPLDDQTAPPTASSHDQRPSLLGLEHAVDIVKTASFKWSLDRSLYDEETLNMIDNYPPLIDVNGGAVRSAMKAKQEQESLKEEEEQRNMLQAMSAVDDDDNMASGSLQLGGEPKTQDNQW